MLLPTEEQEALSSFTLEQILSGIHVFRCHDYIELLALVNLLPDFVRENNKVMIYTLYSFKLEVTSTICILLDALSKFVCKVIPQSKREVPACTHSDGENALTL